MSCPGHKPTQSAAKVAAALQRPAQPSDEAKHGENTADNHPGLAASDVARHYGNATADEAYGRQERRVERVN